VESQRNLYQLEVVSLASVSMAPDTLQADPDDLSRATVLVSVVEAPLREVEAAARLRHGGVPAGGGALDASQLHGRRAAADAARLREPAGRGRAVRHRRRPLYLSHGARRRTFRRQTFDYRFPRLHAAVPVEPSQPARDPRFAQRQSEPGVFQREAVGSRTSVSRRLGARSGGSAYAEAEQGATRASPALFCAAFLVCEPETIAELTGPRFRSELGANYFMDRTNAPLDPSAGYVVRTGSAWAPGAVVRHLVRPLDRARARGTGRCSRAGSPRIRCDVGNFFRTIGWTTRPVPATRRAVLRRRRVGSVRGFARNELGPGIYVTTDRMSPVRTTRCLATARFVPTGGTAVTVANAELRMPSPVLGDLLRLVAFVDAGAVGTRALWDLGREDWRITPGIGMRLQTPIGPVRMDLGFNPHDPAVGPLLFLERDDDGELTGRVIRAVDDFQAPGRAVRAAPSPPRHRPGVLMAQRRFMAREEWPLIAAGHGGGRRRRGARAVALPPGDARTGVPLEVERPGAGRERAGRTRTAASRPRAGSRPRRRPGTPDHANASRLRVWPARCAVRWLSRCAT
jgi:hypothetical protein